MGLQGAMVNALFRPKGLTPSTDLSMEGVKCG